MAKRGRHRKGGRTTPKGTRPLGDRGGGVGSGGRGSGGAPLRLPPPAAHGRPDPFSNTGAPGLGGWGDADDGFDDALSGSLFADLEAALDSPASFLEFAARIRSAFQDEGDDAPNTTRVGRRPSWDDDDDLELDLEHVGLHTFVGAVVGSGERAAIALAHALYAIESDTRESRLIARAIPTRRPALPAWISQLDQVEVETAFALHHLFDDSENLMVGLRLGDERFSLVTLVDHNLGTVVKDAYLTTEPVEQIRTFMQERTADEDMTTVDLSPADAAARLRQAIRHFDLAVGLAEVLESETWPTIRPVVEWALRNVASDGTPYIHSAWSSDDRADLAEAVFDLPDVAEPTDAVFHTMTDLIDYGCQKGLGDPLRWSPLQIEYFLVAVGPEVAVGTPTALQQVPDLLRALIRHGHGQTRVPDRLTRESLAAVDRWEPEWLEAVPRMVLLDDDDEVDDDVDLDDLFRQVIRERLRELSDAVGGDLALENLDDTPLPDEALDTTDLPDEVAQRLQLVAFDLRRSLRALLRHRAANRVPAAPPQARPH